MHRDFEKFDFGVDIWQGMKPLEIENRICNCGNTKGNYS